MLKFLPEKHSQQRGLCDCGSALPHAKPTRARPFFRDFASQRITNPRRCRVTLRQTCYNSSDLRVST